MVNLAANTTQTMQAVFIVRATALRETTFSLYLRLQRLHVDTTCLHSVLRMPDYRLEITFDDVDLGMSFCDYAGSIQPGRRQHH